MRKTDDVSAVVTLLQGFLAQADLPPDGRLPSERRLANEFGLPRAVLRKALDVLEADGLVWRHVGKGTFVGAGPSGNIGELTVLAKSLTPSAVMQARLVLEPQLAAMAAARANAALTASLSATMVRSRAPGSSWREYEVQDARFHREIAEAAGNELLLHLFDQLAAVRRAVTWSRDRGPAGGPPRDHHSFDDHARIAAAIGAGDETAAADAMRMHVLGVASRFPTDDPGRAVLDASRP